VSSGRLLVVGAGQAGVQLASSVRELGWDGPVTLVGAEPYAPYARPPLSKAFLHGAATVDSLALRSAEFYAEHRIEVVREERVDRVDLTGGGAGTAIAASGGQWTFDRLALATGAAPRSLPIEGADLDGVHVLRNVHDAEALGRRLATVDDLVVIGGGFIGLEVAAGAAAAGVRTTVVEAASALMNRVVSAATAQVVEAAHRDAGVRVRTGVRPHRIIGESGAVTAVELPDGDRLPAQLVLVGVGARPRDDLARTAGLRCDDGIVVDACSLASDGFTIAVGDCANLPDPSPTPGPGPRLRLESVDNAVEQARAAATTLLGDPRRYRGVPWFWSDQGEVKLQIAGLARAEDDVVTRTGHRPGQHTALRYRNGQLVAAECLNSPADFLTVRKALVAGTPLTPEAAGDVRLSLKEHFGQHRGRNSSVTSLA
jgi:3-phenylpropionate/trans-cinnamate dioxygenase ferredoxin reductase subunit